MKKLSTCTLLFLGALVVNSAKAQTRIVGNNQVQNVVRNVAAFSSIEKSGSVDMILVQATQPKVTVVAESNIQQYVQTEVKNGVLHVYMKTPNVSFWRVHKLEVIVEMNDLKNLSINGSGDVESRGALKTPSLNINKDGSGDLSLDINTGSLTLDKKGSGDISFNGTINELQIKASSSGDISLKGNGEKLTVVKSGSGDLEAKRFQVNDLQITNSGSGDAEIWANGTLSMKNSGSGDIEYSGKAQITQSIKTGSGDIEKD